MKKLIAILLVMVFVFLLVGCNNEADQPIDDNKEKNDENKMPFTDSLILLESAERMTKPYENFVWSEFWSGGGWFSTDANRASWRLNEIQDEIPQITYSDDFKIHYREDVEFRSLEVYNSAFENVCRVSEEDIPIYFTSGVYYLVIEVKKRGEYIKEQEKFETSGYECVYKFEISNEDEIEFKFSFANCKKFEDYSLNSDKFDLDDGVSHLPIFKFDSAAELKQFKEQFGGEKTYDYGWDDILAFNEATREYDDEFFAQNSLILVYVSATTGSYRFAVKDVSYDGTKFVAYIARTNSPELVTDDLAFWFITFEVKKSDMENITEFDAELVKREK